MHRNVGLSGCHVLAATRTASDFVGQRSNIDEPKLLGMLGASVDSGATARATPDLMPQLPQLVERPRRKPIRQPSRLLEGSYLASTIGVIFFAALAQIVKLPDVKYCSF